MAKEDVTIKIGADAALAKRAIDKFAGEATSIAKSIAGVFAGALAGFSIKEAIDEAVEFQKEILKLKGALKLTNSESDETVNNFVALAEEMSLLTGINDKAYLSQITYLKSLGATNAEIEKLIPVAVDLSSVFSQDVGSSVNQLVQTFSGTVPRALGKAVPALKNLTETELRAGKAVDILREKFQGFSQSIQGSVAVQLANLKNNTLKVVEGIGTAIINSEVFRKVLLNVNTALISLSEAIKKMDLEDFLIILTRISGALASVYIGLNITRVIAGLSASFKGLSASITLANVSLKAFKIVATFGLSILIDYLIQIAVGLRSITDDWDSFTQTLKSGLGYLLRPIMDFLLKVLDLFERIPGVGKFDDLRDAMKEIKKDTIEWNKELKKAGDKASKAGKKVIGAEGNATEGSSGLVTRKESFLDSGEKFAKEVGSALKGGQEGGRNLLVKATSTGIEKATGLPADVVEPFIDVLSQGKEKAQELVRGLLDSIPLFVRSLLTAIGPVIAQLFASLPDLVQGLIDGLLEGIDQLVASLPEIVQKLGESMPQVAAKLAAQAPFIGMHIAISLAKQAPYIAKETVMAMVKETPRFITALIDELKNLIPGMGGIFGGGGGGGGGLGGIVRGAVSIATLGLFAEGGYVPNGYPNDKFPARLTSGEFVINNQLTPRLERFLENSERGQSPQNQQVVVKLMLGEKELANTIFNLNRQGYRLA